MEIEMVKRTVMLTDLLKHLDFVMVKLKEIETAKQKRSDFEMVKQTEK